MTTYKRRKAGRPGPKLLALDLGERRIGIAISDDMGIIASPLETVDLRKSSIERVAELAANHNVHGIVAGLPKTMKGEEGYQAREARSMAKEIEEIVEVPVLLWDERLTSSIADQIIGPKRKKSARKEQRDAVAAAVLLQSYLDAHPLSPARRD